MLFEEVIVNDDGTTRVKDLDTKALRENYLCQYNPNQLRCGVVEKGTIVVHPMDEEQIDDMKV